MTNITQTTANEKTWHGFLFVFVVGGCYAYLVSFLSSVLAISYPNLRFYGKYVTYGVLSAIAVRFLFFSNIRRLPQMPGLFFGMLYYAYIVGIHDVLFTNQEVIVGASVINLYLAGLLFLFIPKNAYEYHLLIKILFYGFLMTLTAYAYYLITSPLHMARVLSGARSDVRELGGEININTLSYIGCIFAILGVRLAELSSNPDSTLRKTVVLLGFFLSTLISFIHLSFGGLTLTIGLMFWYIFRTMSFKRWLFSLCLVSIFALILLNAEVFSSLNQHLVDRAHGGGSYNTRNLEAELVIERFLDGNIWLGNREDILNVGGTFQHTFYLNVLAVHGFIGFALFMFFIARIMLRGVYHATVAQKMTRVFFMSMWLVAPSSYIQIVALFLILPIPSFMTKREHSGQLIAEGWSSA